ncbi:hypothetical protein DERF_001529 [Dermatophagoides farinae]|uniref:Uncharacterized protein n=1 Tax=Dermatophagoides farinae TaxID=6954 RepID=A0A922IDW6_DERFA|nr:hypothetical protein DERF_001529 [Dermatophagoides farinae]
MEFMPSKCVAIVIYTGHFLLHSIDEDFGPNNFTLSARCHDISFLYIGIICIMCLRLKQHSPGRTPGGRSDGDDEFCPLR